MKNQHQKGRHLSLEERIEIYRLHESGCSAREIGRSIGRNHTVICRELSRNSKPYSRDYKALEAHQRAKHRSWQQRQTAPLKNPQVFLYVKEKLRDKWTPEQIAGRISKDLPGERISYETIYQHIYTTFKKEKLWTHLVRSRKKRKLKRKTSKSWKERIKIQGKTSIDNRPTRANNRTRVGDWETDLMESNRGVDVYVSADIERKTRFTKLNNPRLQVEGFK